MDQTDEAWRYSTEDLPPAKNPVLYAYRCILKAATIIVFGTTAFLFGLTLLPLLRLILHPAWRFKKIARAVTHLMFRFSLGVLQLLGGIKLDVQGKEVLRSMKGKILVANHPSILDGVILISLVPNADCIMRGSLTHSVMAGVVRQLYIVNDMGYEQLLPHCRKSLEEGANIIIFPEGTRTPRHGTNKFKRGAAHIAHDTGADIQVLYIGGNDKYGLGKHDSFFSYNKEEIYHYDLHLLPAIHAADYAELPGHIAARRMTEKMHELLATEALARDNRIL